MTNVAPGHAEPRALDRAGGPAIDTNGLSGEAGPLPAPRRLGLIAALGNALVIGAGTSLCLVVFHYGVGGLRASIALGQGHDPIWTALLYLALASVMVAVGMPRQVVILTAGVVFSIATGALLSLLAQAAACGLDYLWARLLVRERTLARLLGAGSGRLGRFVAPLRRAPFRVTLCLRLLPIGSNVLLNLLAGALGLRLIPFAAASVIGYLPQTAVFLMFGRGIRLADWTQWGLALALLIASAGLAMTLLRAPAGADP